MDKIRRFARKYIALCSENEISTAAAALSYYLTLTFFPLIICLYAFLGSNYIRALKVIDFLRRLIPGDVARILTEFLAYVSENNSAPMLAAGLAVLISSSSAAIRSLQAMIGKMQGGQRFHGMKDVLFSLVFAFVFIAAMYLAVLMMITGREFVMLIGRIIPFVDADSSWMHLRFMIMAGAELFTIRILYHISKREEDRYSTAPGAAFAAFGMVAVSFVFSGFISASSKYPLVYGSLAAMILLMFWLYLCCIVIYLGAAINITYRDIS